MPPSFACFAKAKQAALSHKGREMEAEFLGGMELQKRRRKSSGNSEFYVEKMGRSPFITRRKI